MTTININAFHISAYSRVESVTASSIHMAIVCDYHYDEGEQISSYDSQHIFLFKSREDYDCVSGQIDAKIEKGDLNFADLSEHILAHVEGEYGEFTGLLPNTSYVAYFVVYIGGMMLSSIEIANTQELTLTTSQPQVISNGNVILSAETNIDDAETNIGFEWRRTDWTDDFASNRGEATLRNGIMEGYIFNLNTEKLWKYRPYYISNSGTYYYGEWVGIDPTNTPNDEPTIYTDETTVVEGNTAIIKGYTSIDTGQLESQGFKYWKVTEETESMEMAIPMNATTIETNGQMMTANLTGLDYNSTYHYVAFVTTIEGETLYGEVHAFTIGEDPTGIEGMQLEPVTIVARYNISGQQIFAPQKGINILHMSDGTMKKVLVK